MTDDAATTLRLPAVLLARADNLTARLPAPAGGKLSRSNVLRAALDRGLTDLEVEVTRPTSPPDLAALAAEVDALRLRIEALSTPAPAPNRASLEPCNVIRPAAGHAGYCRCGHAMTEHVAVYGAAGELVQLRGSET